MLTSFPTLSDIGCLRRAEHLYEESGRKHTDTTNFRNTYVIISQPIYIRLKLSQPYRKAMDPGGHQGRYAQKLLNPGCFIPDILPQLVKRFNRTSFRRLFHLLK